MLSSTGDEPLSVDSESHALGIVLVDAAALVSMFGPLVVDVIDAADDIDDVDVDFNVVDAVKVGSSDCRTPSSSRYTSRMSLSQQLVVPCRQQ
jgi:hypothetical protein